MTREEILFVRALGDKRARDEAGVFVVEGRKALSELGGFAVRRIYCREGSSALAQFGAAVPLSAREMERISFLKTPTDVLAVVEKPFCAFSPERLRTGLVLALDEVQNPGNVGTIIRLADWFGISDVLCSAGCADVFAPKVVQATMGSLARVAVHYGELAEMITAISTTPALRATPPSQGGDFPVYGAFLDGENIYRAGLSASGIVVLGSEGHGISAAVERLVTRRIVIPRLGGGESLNVAIAGAIICSEFSRSRA